MRRAKQSGYTFRNVCPADIQQLATLHAALFPVQYPRSYYHQLFTQGNFCIVAVTDDNECIGVASGRLIPPEDQDWDLSQILCCCNCCVCCYITTGYIMTLGVSDAYRGQGIGAELLEKICVQLEQAGCNYIYLHVKVGNETATKFYLKHGFNVEEELPNYYAIDGKHFNSYKMSKSSIKKKERMWSGFFRWITNKKSKDYDLLNTQKSNLV